MAIASLDPPCAPDNDDENDNNDDNYDKSNDNDGNIFLPPCAPRIKVILSLKAEDDGDFDDDDV